MKRYAARADANQAEIMRSLRAVGADVIYIGTPVDLLVGFRSENFLIEVKDSRKSPSQRKLTQAQVDFINRWRGTVYVVTTAEEAIKVITK